MAPVDMKFEKRVRKWTSVRSDVKYEQYFHDVGQFPVVQVASPAPPCERLAFFLVVSGEAFRLVHSCLCSRYPLALDVAPSNRIPDGSAPPSAMGFLESPGRT